MTMDRGRSRGRGDTPGQDAKSAPPVPVNQERAMPEQQQPEPVVVKVGYDELQGRLDGVEEMVKHVLRVVDKLEIDMESLDAGSRSSVSMLSNDISGLEGVVRSLREDFRADVNHANERQLKTWFDKPERPATVCKAEPLHCKAEPLECKATVCKAEPLHCKAEPMECKAQPVICGFGRDNELHDRVEMAVQALSNRMNCTDAHIEALVSRLRTEIEYAIVKIDRLGAKPSLWARLLKLLRIK